LELETLEDIHTVRMYTQFTVKDYWQKKNFWSRLRLTCVHIRLDEMSWYKQAVLLGILNCIWWLI